MTTQPMRFQRGAQIGAGGFGRVFSATRVDDEWECVMKYLKEDYDEEDLRRFQREVRLQSLLNHHNVTRIVAMNLTHQPPWFVMPKAAMNLRQYMTTHPNGDSISVFSQIAAGVNHAHDNGVVHRDLKPENVLVFVGDGKVEFAVADFGLGRKLVRDSTTLTQKNVRLGTVEYMAPEQWEDARNADSRADIYALGKILYEMLTKKLPHPHLDLSAVPRKFVFIIQKATRIDPEQRYRTVTELTDAITFVTTSAGAFDKPAESIRALIASIIERTAFDGESTETLAQMLCDNADDDRMMASVFPHIPEPVLSALIQHHRETFSHTFERYDEECACDVTFEYCDVIANFYERVFNLTEDDDVRQRILRRLPVLGASNNRWHVGSVFARIVGSLTDPALVMGVRDVLQASPGVAEFNAPYLRDYTIPPAIREVLPKPE